ncbi:Hemolysin-type calcium-binding protein repeat protein (2 copies)/Hint domain protein [Phaeobacter piscinae]|uniref:Hemolysin-type calcium-binding protein repeat protein (2 copies)/Hint domain protein n=1 Tax=Phaeobacter piscinae TaxID=1580596 RepID=A0ABM6PGN0_9RHOB|nr:Hint domain-containing protein [Phaeobacter piscinae]ATG36952.1 Hemolysin-type calcium-binding protein repeat protein (2 copies)/Hint domain protein [Phaeobacter piscinae]AUQ87473.1 Hemolysin-type calcium-binding protein repeat protein (2 copies)/Hint domain protein [Phaeobacter piscinae]AUR25356.1 Hemolysin-type calcium-binding protein repeat protein (2 copies)/Hint domain protein [Phaeobacter piscinae]
MPLSNWLENLLTNLIGGRGKDKLGGTTGDDTMDAGEGDDTVAGEEGNDLIDGGDGDDIIYGDMGDGFDQGMQASPLTLDINNMHSVSHDGGTGSAGNYAVFSNVATLEDGTSISGKLVLVEKSNANMSVEFGYTSGAEILLDGDQPGDQAKFRLEFFDPATGETVYLNSTATFNDIDDNSYYGDAEAVIIDGSSFTSFGVSADSSLTTDINGDVVKATGSELNDYTDQDSWFSASFEDRSSIEFTLQTRAGLAGFTLSGDILEDPVTTIIDQGADTVMAGVGDDIVHGQGGDDSLLGEEGDDLLDGGEGDDVMEGGTGADTLLGGAGGDTLSGGDGDDYIEGGEGDDRLSTGIGNDTLLGGEGNDTLNNSAGDDSLVGGTGDDSIVATDGHDTLEGGDGADTMYGGNDNDLLVGGADNDLMYGETGDDSLDGGTGDDLMDGGTGNDTLMGGLGADTIAGGDGDDYIDGGDGDDSLTTGLGNDTLIGGAGNDTLRNSAGDDSLVGGTGDDSIVATDGNDTLEGGDGADTMYGGNDNDLLVGGAGDDKMYGEADADTFQMSDGFGNDTISGGEAGNDSDHIDLSNVTSSVTVTYSGYEAGQITDGADTISFSEIEQLTLTDQADIVDASTDNAGVDIDAGAGDDTITFGEGDDSITGGAGDDELILTEGGGVDTVSDFDLNDDDGNGFYNDQLDVSDLAGGSGTNGAVRTGDVAVADDGFGNALLTFPGGEQLVLQGVTPAQMSSHNQLYAAGIPCFTPDVLLATRRGAVPAGQIRVGDLLQTADNGFQPVIWVGRRHLSAADLMHRPQLRPYCLRPGGLLSPDRPMLLSPQHRLIVNDGCLMPEQPRDESFVSAKLLAEMDGGFAAQVTQQTPVTYVHLMTEQHEVIFAEGIATETFWPGPEAIRGLSVDDLRELLTLFPELATVHGLSGEPGRRQVRKTYGDLARRSLRRRDIANRHAA